MRDMKVKLTVDLSAEHNKGAVYSHIVTGDNAMLFHAIPICMKI